ncbi:substrate-binding periplasmic protein [candidate division CSSED10-310 bacterium]|uniref:Substrate-binding periplasmic protein n=1 Tax=candidate division CSSED10-310 bacterium TaxID=2855610 RepID=A0ABV6Z6K3_UNCC1
MQNLIHIQRLALYFTLAFLMSLLIGQPTYSEELPQLIINDSDWPPYFFAGKADSPKGLGKEILEVCLAKVLENEVIFKYHPIREMWSYLMIGRIDLNVNSYKESREETMLFSHEPIFSAGYKPIVLADSQITINTLKDFDPLNIGHLDGLKYSDWFLEYILNRQTGKSKVPGKIFVVKSADDLISMLLEKKIDVFVEAGDSTFWRAKKMGLAEKMKSLDFEIRTSNYFLTLSKKSNKIKNKQGFLNNFDECLRQFKKDDQYLTILKNYGFQ